MLGRLAQHDFQQKSRRTGHGLLSIDRKREAKSRHRAFVSLSSSAWPFHQSRSVLFRKLSVMSIRAVLAGCDVAPLTEIGRKPFRV